MPLDPTTFAILRSSFINIANEMGLTLGKVAYSPVITEGRDFAGAVYDANGHLVACGEHDLTGLLGTMEPTIQFIFDWLGKENLHEGDVVFVNSEFTKGEVVELLGVSADKVVVAYPGVEVSAEGPRADLGRPYVLTVATLEPRKNLETLLAAPLPAGHALAVVGAAGWGPQPKLDRPDVIRLGYVDDHELARLYRGAAAFVYPSRFEGFGIPVLEAMAAGCPVIAADATALPEVVDGVGRLVGTDDIAGWEAAMGAALETPRSASADDERRRAAQFSSDRSVAALVDAYRRAAATRR